MAILSVRTYIVHVRTYVWKHGPIYRKRVTAPISMACPQNLLYTNMCKAEIVQLKQLRRRALNIDAYLGESAGLQTNGRPGRQHLSANACKRVGRQTNGRPGRQHLSANACESIGRQSKSRPGEATLECERL